MLNLFQSSDVLARLAQRFGLDESWLYETECKSSPLDDQQQLADNFILYLGSIASSEHRHASANNFMKNVILSLIFELPGSAQVHPSTSPFTTNADTQGVLSMNTTTARRRKQNWYPPISGKAKMYSSDDSTSGEDVARTAHLLPPLSVDNLNLPVHRAPEKSQFAWKQQRGGRVMQNCDEEDEAEVLRILSEEPAAKRRKLGKSTPGR